MRPYTEAELAQNLKMIVVPGIKEVVAYSYAVKLCDIFKAEFIWFNSRIEEVTVELRLEEA